MAQKILNPDGTTLLYKNQEVFQSEFVGVVKEVNLNRRTMQMVGTDETKDRDGDIIRLSGWDLENYRKNPVFLWAHAYSSVPLARAEKVIKKREPDSHMLFHLQYPTKGLHPFADMILELYSELIINASSVGFIPKKWNNLEEENKDDSNARRTWGREFIKQELLELSGCAVPSNPNALQNALKGKVFGGTKIEDMIQWMTGAILIPKPEKEDDIRQELTGKGMEIEDETLPPMIQVPEKYDIPEKFEEGEKVEKEDVLKPYPNEHACRLEDPGKFDSFARQNCKVKHSGKCVDFIYGIKSGKSALQAMRYKKDVWAAGAAKSHCSSHGGSFEAAKEVELEEIKSTSIKIMVDEEDVKELKSKLSEINLAIKSLVDRMEKDSVNGQVKTNDKVPAESTTGAPSVILDEAFIQGKKSQIPDPPAKIQTIIQSPKFPVERIKELLVALQELKAATDEVKKMK